jgi:hypothetical protein
MGNLDYAAIIVYIYFTEVMVQTKYVPLTYNYNLFATGEESDLGMVKQKARVTSPCESNWTVTGQACQATQMAEAYVTSARSQ